MSHVKAKIVKIDTPCSPSGKWEEFAGHNIVVHLTSQNDLLSFVGYIQNFKGENHG